MPFDAIVLSDAINAVATPIRLPETDADESDDSKADTGGFRMFAKDASALSAANVTLAEYSVPAVDENGAWANADMPNIIRQPGLVDCPQPASVGIPDSCFDPFFASVKVPPFCAAVIFNGLGAVWAGNHWSVAV